MKQSVQNIMVIDLDRCIGCMACQVACKLENEVALGADRIRVLTIGPTGTYPDLQMYFLPVMCQQCEEPPCVAVCPTGASYRRTEAGDIQIDRDICIGCQSCYRACPYALNIFNNELRIMDKCDQCAHLQKIGEKPACVKNCPGRAMFFGDANDPDSDVSRILCETDPAHVHTLPDSGNRPMTRYILRKSDWVEIMPQEVPEPVNRRRQR
ncbi:MAG: 4Fe-4S dicluster domain-containing protein [Saccharofermentanales bacterium]|jgi:Fe-S-cluster-containing dehydrogenase component|nr:4Fe-4S dicluster domain-containing protein [Clostridiaceae bacterium]